MIHNGAPSHVQRSREHTNAATLISRGGPPRLFSLEIAIARNCFASNPIQPTWLKTRNQCQTLLCLMTMSTRGGRRSYRSAVAMQPSHRGKATTSLKPPQHRQRCRPLREVHLDSYVVLPVSSACTCSGLSAGGFSGNQGNWSHTWRMLWPGLSCS
jgi:hypothetical protein